MMKLRCLLFLLMLPVACCYAQYKGNNRLVKTQGTQQYTNIHCAIQDRAGNLWFGTTGEGVYRYDGKYFTQFTTKDGLSGNTVWCLLADKAGNIWLGTNNGLCRYDGKMIRPISLIGSLPGYQLSDHNKNTSTQHEVVSLLQDRKGTIWVGTRGGVYCYSGIAFTRFLDNPNIINADSLTLNMIDCMLEDKDGTIWLGSGSPPGMEGLCRYDGKTLTRYKPGGDGWIRSLLQDKAGTLWIGTRHSGVWQYDGKAFSKFKKDDGCAMLQDRAGNIWFSGSEADNGYGGNGGIWRYDGKAFTNFNTKDGLDDYSVWSMIEDKAGHIWVGTRNNGLYRYDGKRFSRFSE